MRQIIAKQTDRVGNFDFQILILRLPYKFASVSMTQISGHALGSLTSMGFFSHIISCHYFLLHLSLN